MGQPNNSSFYGNNLINDDNGLYLQCVQEFLQVDGYRHIFIIGPEIQINLPLLSYKNEFFFFEFIKLF